MLERLKSKIIHAKIYAERSISYIGIINTVMLLFLTLSNLDKYGIEVDVKMWILPLALILILLLILAGYIEDKIGLFSKDIEIRGTRNPP